MFSTPRFRLWLSRIHAVVQKNFNAKAQRGQPQPNFRHEGHEDHEEKSYNLSYSMLRVLRALNPYCMVPATNP
jgi:hypothetical protein